MKIALIIASAFFAFGTAAQADNGTTVIASSPYVERVSYQPADLASAAGIRDLRRRVRSAAHRVCQPGEDTFMPTYNAISCTSPTLKDAFAQIDRAVARGGAPSLAAASIAVRAR